MLEFRCDRAALDNLLEPAGVDVVFYLHSMLAAVLVDQLKPAPHTLKKLDSGSEAAQVVTFEGDALAMCLVEHQLHV